MRKKKCFTYYRSNGNSNEGYHQQQSEGNTEKMDNNITIWRSCHNSGSHLNAECHHQQRDSKREESSTADGKSKTH